MKDIKDQIAEKFVELTLKNNKTNISVKEICAETLVSRTTFYKYFKDSYSVIEYIFIQDSMESMDILVKNHLGARVIMEYWFCSFLKHREFYKIAIVEEGQNSFFETVIQTVEEYNKKLFSPQYNGEELEYCAYKYAALQVMLLKKWIKDGMKASPEMIAECFLKDYLHLC